MGTAKKHITLAGQDIMQIQARGLEGGRGHGFYTKVKGVRRKNKGRGRDKRWGQSMRPI